MNQPTCEVRPWVTPLHQFIDQNKSNEKVSIMYDGRYLQIWPENAYLQIWPENACYMLDPFKLPSTEHDFIPCLREILRYMRVGRIELYQDVSLRPYTTRDLFQLLNSAVHLDKLYITPRFPQKNYSAVRGLFVNGIIGVLQNLPRLSSIILGGGVLTEKQCIRVANALIQHPSMNHVCFVGVDVSCDGAISLCKIFARAERIGILRLPRVVHIASLDSPYRMDDVVQEIRGMIEKSSIRELRMYDEALTDQHMLTIARGIRVNLNFRQLDIHSDLLTDHVVVSFSSVVGSEHPNFDLLMVVSSRMSVFNQNLLVQMYPRYHTMRIRRLISLLYVMGTKSDDGWYTRDILKCLNTYL